MGHMALCRVNATFASPSRQLRELVPLALRSCLSPAMPAPLDAFLPPMAGKFVMCSLVLAFT